MRYTPFLDSGVPTMWLLLLLVILILVIGAAPAWPYSRGWGYGPSGGLGVRYSFFGCDYSLVIPTDNAQELVFHKLSLVLRFDIAKIL